MSNIITLKPDVPKPISDQILEKLAFPVIEMPVYTATLDQQVVQVPNHKSIIRSDTGKPLSIVSSGYGVVPYADTIEPLSAIINEMGFEPKKLWLKDDGAAMKLEAHASEMIEINGDDHTPVLWIDNSYDRTSSLSVKFGYYRLVCSNGMVVPEFLGGSLILKMKHTKNASIRYENWADQLHMADDILPRFKARLQAIHKPIDDHIAKQILAKIFGADDENPMDNKNVVLSFDRARHGKGQNISDRQPITGWNLYNGVTETISTYIDTRKDETKTFTAMKNGHGKIERAFEIIHSQVA